MTKIEFLNRLEELLEDLPTEERESALRYYDDYFEDAGIENTDAVISELGSAEKVAAFIRSDLIDNSWKDSEKIIYTENGYKDTKMEEDRFEVVRNDCENHTKEESSPNKKTDPGKTKPQSGNNNTSKILLIIILCIIAIPVGILVLSSAFGIIVSILAGIGGIFIAFAAATAALLIVGIVLFVTGLVQLFFSPSSGILMCGAGLILLGLGILAAILILLICTRLIPFVVKKVGDSWRRFKKRRDAQ